MSSSYFVSTYIFFRITNDQIYLDHILACVSGTVKQGFVSKKKSTKLFFI